MSASGVQLVVLAAVTTAFGEMMIRLGIANGRLQRRFGRRTCQSCGRTMSARGCEHCGF
jgi:hypothetical protein